MPVDFEQYDPDESGGLRLTAETNARVILEFLADNPAQGFTPKEIADATDVPRGSVGSTLSRLEERALVRHREPYWAIGDDDRLATYASMLHGLESAADRFEDDDWSGWRETAVDPRAESTVDSAEETTDDPAELSEDETATDE